MLLIDVDGTLVDSVPDLAFCVDAMQHALGFSRHGEAKVRNWVGNGLERLVKRALTGEMETEPDAALYAKALPVFYDLYRHNISQRSVLYPGVREGLEYLKLEGYKLGSVTNKAERFTVPLLGDLGIDQYFSLIVSGDTLEKKKPDPAPLLYAADQLGVKPADAMMIGDSISDVKAARAADFQIICVSYGYNHGQDIRIAEPDAIIDSLAQLRNLLEQAA
ncbi:MAG: phosphoglycolate phosphatase [Gammaproteobacteria bacterium]|nr:MAG: phosphoglycolate phosphatase [Gammaproteobacteria bacterium]